MLNTRHAFSPISQRSISTPSQIKTPFFRTTLVQVPIPSKPIKTVYPIQRRVLRDSRTANHLNLKNYLKMAQLAPASRTTSQQKIKPQLAVSSSLTILPTSMPMHNPTSSANRARQFRSRSLKPNVLKATAPGTGSISKSKVGLDRIIPPVYPRIARESGWEGTVLVRVVVQPDGSPDSIKIRKSSGYPVLDHAAIDAIKKWRFLPAKDGNFSIRSVVEIPINFDLKTTRIIEVMNKDLHPW